MKINIEVVVAKDLNELTAKEVKSEYRRRKLGDYCVDISSVIRENQVTTYSYEFRFKNVNISGGEHCLTDVYKIAIKAHEVFIK